MSLVGRLGPSQALASLVELLAGELSGEELVWSDNRRVLVDIGDGHARRLMTDGTGARLVYWPRVWAARSMAYLDDTDAVGPLVNCVSDEHWRVRMTCVQSLGRLGAEGLTSELVHGLDDDHWRVREATVVALGRIGDSDALWRLSLLLDKEPENRKVEAAISHIDRRSAT